MAQYLRAIGAGAVSIAGTCLTAVPYLFRWGELHKEVTEGYPDPVSSKTSDDLPPRSRGLLVNDIDHCTGCGDCRKICPVQCIHLEVEPQADDSKVWVSRFDIDNSKCMFCGLCVEVCLPGSLNHTRQFEGAAYELSQLTSSFGKGQVTAEQKAKWAAKRESNKKKEGL